MCYRGACVFQIHFFSMKSWNEYKVFAHDDRHCVCMFVASFCAKWAFDIHFWNKDIGLLSVPTINKIDFMTGQICWFAKYFFKKWTVFAFRLCRN